MRVFSEFADTSGNGTGEKAHHDSDAIQRNLAAVKATLVLASAKGGTGKSLLAVNIAGVLAHAGKKIGIMDADLNAPSILPMLGTRAPLRFPCSGRAHDASLSRRFRMAA